jgi:hypothetical protein
MTSQTLTKASLLTTLQVHRRLCRQGGFASSEGGTPHSPREASHGGDPAPGPGQ